MPFDPLEKLHPELREVYKQIQSSPQSHQLDIRTVRENFAASILPAPQITVGSVEDVIVDGPRGDLRIRFYHPEGSGPFPIIAHFHGGGFAMGSLDIYDGQSRLLCKNTNAIVATIDYGLAPENRFPAAFDDSYAAVVWLAENARAISADSERIGVAGDSAGGMLTISCAITARDRNGPKLLAQMPIVAGMHGFKAKGAALERRAIRQNATFSVDDCNYFASLLYTNEIEDVDPRINLSMVEDFSRLPPAVIVAAEVDILYEESFELARKLVDAKVEAQIVDAKGMFHPFFTMGHLFPAAHTYVVDASKRFGTLLRR